MADTGCLLGHKGSIFLLYEHQALIGHSFLNQSGTTRIQCVMLCFRHKRCLSVNHDDISGICQLNDGRKEDFPESYKQDGGFSYFEDSNKAKPITGEMTTATTTERETSQAQAATTEQVSVLIL